MILYVDGDSCSTPNLAVNESDSYWKLFADHIGADKIINYSYPGKSVEGMLRSATRFIVENDTTDVFLLIGLSFLCRRDEILDGPVGPWEKGATPYPNPNPAEPHIGSKNLWSPAKNKGLIAQIARQLNIQGGGHIDDLQESNFYSNIILFNSFLQSRKVKNLMHYHAIPIKRKKSVMLDSLRNEVDQMPNVLNLHQDTLLTWGMRNKIKPVDFDRYGWVGHYGAEVNKLYANYLIENYQRVYNAPNS